MNREKILQAGKIASEVKKYARQTIKKGMPLLEIAEKLEGKIEELGGKPAFPMNLSINEIAAHYTPTHDDKKIAEGLLKIDIGVHIDGWVADTAFSLDLENSEENKKLIKASEEAVSNAIKVAKENIQINQIGRAIQEAIESNGFNPIINLSGHSIGQYEVHAGETIPNIYDNRKAILTKGLYAIEPFATTGSGRVYDGPESGIYSLTSERNVRSPIAREILNYIIEEYKTLPFCSRWLVKKFGTKALFGLKQLKTNGNVHSYSQLTEYSKKNVAQSEQTILVEKDNIIVTTE